MIIYRRTTIGDTLNQSLTEMVERNTISKQLAEKVLREFDKQISLKLSTVGNRIHFTGDLDSYQQCQNVWTLFLRDCLFRNEFGGAEVAVDRLKIVACEGPKMTMGTH